MLERDFPKDFFFTPELLLAAEAAWAAGQVVRDGSGKIKKIERKGVGDLVSEVDRNADRAACSVLSAGSDLPILSEELNADAEARDDLWIVDPLDASNAFLTKAGDQYPSVLIALRRGGETEVGIVYFPLTDQWFYAQRGKGAYCEGKRLVCDGSEPLDSVWVEMNHYGNAKYETSFFRNVRDALRGESGAQLVTANVPNSGVAMRIAAGTSALQAAIHDNNPAAVKQASWDIAAPQIILEEAGGVFLNHEGQRSDPFRCEPIIVARSRELAMQIVELSKAHQSVS